MDIKEARKICRDIVNQNKAVAKLGEVLDLAEMTIAQVRSAENDLSSIEKEIQPLEDKRSKINQEIQALENSRGARITDIDNEISVYREDAMKKIGEIKDDLEKCELSAKADKDKMRKEIKEISVELEDKKNKLNEINTILSKYK